MKSCVHSAEMASEATINVSLSKYVWNKRLFRFIQVIQGYLGYLGLFALQGYTITLLVGFHK